MLRRINQIIDTDVLVIGGGAAACRAAIAAREQGAKTLVVLKGKLARSGATCAPGGGAAYQASDECVGPEDSPDVHLQDVLAAAAGMADERLARIQVDEVVPRMHDLEAWGFEFAPDPEGKNRHYTSYSCFGTQPRAHCIPGGGAAGHAGELVVLMAKRMADSGVVVDEETFVTDLLVEDGLCVGAMAVRPGGEVVVYRAKSTVLTAGGARQLFPSRRPRPIDTTGDGYAMALRAGATLTNMEFMQFMLLPEIFPDDLRVPGSFWTLFPDLRNRHGKEIVENRLRPGETKEQSMYERTLHAPFSTRDASGWLDIAVYSETRDGNATDEGGILVDFSHVDLSQFSQARSWHMPEKYHGPVILPKQPMQVYNSAHAINGGLCIDERCESSVTGLYAAGEVAAGPHGADRLGGGMMGACQVFGKRAGEFAAKDSKLRQLTTISDALVDVPLSRIYGQRKGRLSPKATLEALQQVCQSALMVVKNRPGLSQAIDTLEGLCAELTLGEADAGGGVRRRIEVENGILTAQAMAGAAILRQESRGSFFREDFPVRDDASWNVNIMSRLKDGRMIQDRGRLGKKVVG